ncbi:hypothetical protein FQZ97_707020 [compost metagenome]
MALSEFEDTSLAFRDNKNPDLISGDVFEHHVARLRELRIDRCFPSMLECLEVFSDELVGIQVR